MGVGHIRAIISAGPVLVGVFPDGEDVIEIIEC